MEQRISIERMAHSISRTFSSNEPNKLTACSMRSMLMRCSMLCFLLKKC